MPRRTVPQRAALTALLALVPSLPGLARAQDAAPRKPAWELRVSSGAFVPTGDQRRNIEDGHVTAAQVSWVLRPRLALTGTFSWARSLHLATAGERRLDVFTTDVGVEMRSATWGAEGPVALHTFAGLGAGMRSLNARGLDAPATHDVAGFASVGGELGAGRVGLRLEARDYASSYRQLPGSAALRNDVVIMAALRVNRRRTPEG